MEPWLDGTNLGLPYWDWTKDWDTIPDLWEEIKSPIKDSDVLAPFWETTLCQGKDKNYSQRIIETERNKGLHFAGSIEDSLSQTDFAGDFTNMLYQPHGAVHIELDCTMAPIRTTAFDPIFFLHHSFVDKVFADWQKKHETRPSLSTSTNTFDPFNNPIVNKFYNKTNKTPRETLDYTKNLCFCFDSINNCQPDEFFYIDENGNRHVRQRPPRVLATPKKEILQISEIAKKRLMGNLGSWKPPLLKAIKTHFKVYVAVVLPKKVGSRSVKYKVCRKKNNVEDCREEDSVATFNIEITRDRSQDAINSTNFETNLNLFLPTSWKLSKLTEATETWTKIEVLEGGDLVPSQAPPFFVYRFNRGEKVAHLQEGNQRDQYGDLLDDYAAVQDYCSTYGIEKDDPTSPDHLCWNLGHASICRGKQPACLSN